MLYPGNLCIYWYNIQYQTWLRKVDKLVSQEYAAKHCNDRGEQLAAFRTVESLLWRAGKGGEG